MVCSSVFLRPGSLGNIFEPHLDTIWINDPDGIVEEGNLVAQWGDEKLLHILRDQERAGGLSLNGKGI